MMISWHNNKKAAVNVATLMLILLPVTSGCSQGRSDARGQRMAMSGVVMLDGDLLQLGRIIFISDNGNGEVKAAATIRDGAFELTRDNGPIEGDARVEIQTVEFDLEEFEIHRGPDRSARQQISHVVIPAKYNSESTLTAEISANDTQNHTVFTLESD